MSTINYDAEMFRKLQRDAEEVAQEKVQEGDEKGAEYFRGVAAGYRCAAVLIED
jgi:alanyl-tRNA synthetase